jgi:hypothetical protein
VPRNTWQSRAVLSAAALTAILSGAACSDSTAPSTGENSSSPSSTTPAPVKKDSIPAGILAQLPAIADASKGKNLPAAGDATAVPLKMSALAWSTPWSDRLYASGPGFVSVPSGAASCANLSGFRYVGVQGIFVGATPGPSARMKQYVTADVWLYRNGTYQMGQRVGVPLDYGISSGTLGSALFPLSSGGTYHIRVQFIWWVSVTTGWVQTAAQTVDFNGRPEYWAGYGSVAVAGSCTIS